MGASDWRARLSAAIEADARSYRDLSLKAGLGENYVVQMKRSGKTPTIDKFLALCSTLGVSPVYILTGAYLDRDAEELLGLWAKAQPAQRDALLKLLGFQPGP